MKYKLLTFLFIFFVASLALTGRTFSGFNASAIMDGNRFATAAIFPEEEPGEEDDDETEEEDDDENNDEGNSDDNKCRDIDVNIEGNGTGSVNGVIIICKNFEVVKQTNDTEITNEINTESNTGNNEISGSTGGENNIETGDASTTIIINQSGSSNNNSTNPTPTPTPSS